MKVLSLSFIYLLSFWSHAWAYLDPGTGSIILQGAVAALATALFVMKSYFYRIKSFFRRTNGNLPDRGSDD